MQTLINLIKGKFTKAQPAVPPVNSLKFGSFRRVTPLSREFGYDRGGPIDRYYIENFLEDRKNDIQGRVLEVKSNEYTLRFGGQRVKKSEILDIDKDNPRATIIADLTQAAVIESNSFDCVVLTQVLQLIYDYKAAIATIHRILKPGGVLLLTIPGITQIAYDLLGKTWYWTFSEASAKRMLAESFGEGAVDVKIHGNVLAATGFLYGIGATELKKEELDAMDPDYQLIITCRAVKQG